MSDKGPMGLGRFGTKVELLGLISPKAKAKT